MIMSGMVNLIRRLKESSLSENLKLEMMKKLNTPFLMPLHIKFTLEELEEFKSKVIF